MTSLPPAGWYPDPEAGGSRRRWWDGQQWAAPEFGHPTGIPQWGAGPSSSELAASTRRYGRWLRWLMVPYAIVGWAILAAVAHVLSGKDGVFHTTSAGAFEPSSRFFVFQLIALPLNLFAYAFVGLLIAWIWQAGKFAEGHTWPATRNRTLGAFSVVIPVVSLWWPYQAVRDAFPPGTSTRLVLQWWLVYVLVPASSSVLVIVTALAGSGTAVAIALLLAAGLATLPVVFGWRVTLALEEQQRTYVS